jgi:hypothetical protein
MVNLPHDFFGGGAWSASMAVPVVDGAVECPLIESMSLISSPQYACGMRVSPKNSAQPGIERSSYLVRQMSLS